MLSGEALHIPTLKEESCSFFLLSLHSKVGYVQILLNAGIVVWVIILPSGERGHISKYGPLEVEPVTINQNPQEGTKLPTVLRRRQQRFRNILLHWGEFYVLEFTIKGHLSCTGWPRELFTLYLPRSSHSVISVAWSHDQLNNACLGLPTIPIRKKQWHSCSGSDDFRNSFNDGWHRAYPSNDYELIRECLDADLVIWLISRRRFK